MSGAIEATIPKGKFLAFLLKAGALQFGEFTLKSGRVSPYFFNSGRFDTGAQLEILGEFYAAAIAEAAPLATIVFGPAYKGIPLCTSTAAALSRLQGREIGYLFDRKEPKGHGDKGRYVGMEPGEERRLVLVDDVITDGATKLAAVRHLREDFGAPIDALVIAFDRMEADDSGRYALKHFEQDTGIPVVSLLNLEELTLALETMGAMGTPEARPSAPLNAPSNIPSNDSPNVPGGESGVFDLPPNILEKIREYHHQYGARP